MPTTLNDIRIDFLADLRPGKVLATSTWAEDYIDFSEDATHFHRGKLVLRPYQRAILDACDNAKCHQVTVVGAPRLGKSLLWKLVLLKRIWEGGESSLIVYQNDQEAEASNRDTLEPLMRAIPKLKADLDRPRTHTADSYHLANSVIYFQGGGSQIVSKSVRLAIGDEVDKWLLPGMGQGAGGVEARNLDNVAALKMRGQTFPDKLLFLSSTATVYGGPIWREFDHSTRGYYHLRCLQCGHLMPAGQLAFRLEEGKWAGLQWKKDDDHEVIPDTIRYVCRQCRNEHTFADAQKMVDNGQFVHDHIERAHHYGFRIPALCGPDVFSWHEIAQKQEESGTIQGMQLLNNYYLAKPFSPGRDVAKAEKADVLRAHCRHYPPEGTITSVFAGVDVQGYGSGGNYFVVTVRGFDEQGNSWRLYAGHKETLADLHDLAIDKWAGIGITLGAVDHGGFDHDKSGVRQWINTHPRWVWIKGDTQSKATQENGFVMSTAEPRLYLANPYLYQMHLLYAIYSRATDTTGTHFWSLPEDMGEEYEAHIKAMKPSVRRFDNEAYTNWTAGTERHDYFDAEKMIFTLLDIACHNIPSQAWPRRVMPVFLRQQLITEMQKKGLISTSK